MSDAVIDEAIDAEAPEPQGEGQAEPEVGGVENLEEEEVELLSIDEFGNRMVSVQVGGQEVRVPLSEALAGFMRQEDYTRKTQSVAEERKQAQFGVAIQQALENDPHGALEMLNKRYGASQQASDEELDLDPLELAVRRTNQRLDAIDTQNALNQLNQTVASLQTKYGEDFDADEVVARALALGSSDLEGVYKTIAFDRINDERIKLRDTATRKVVGDNKAVVGKRKAAVVSGASTPRSADRPASDSTSIRDAFSKAAIQHPLN